MESEAEVPPLSYSLSPPSVSAHGTSTRAGLPQPSPTIPCRRLFTARPSGDVACCPLDAHGSDMKDGS